MESEDLIFNETSPESDGWQTTYTFSDVQKIMIKFAKHHVQEALKAVVEFREPILLSDMKGNKKTTSRYYANNITASLNKDQLLNAYPLTNIK
jgi:hypothetical protein